MKRDHRDRREMITIMRDRGPRVVQLSPRSALIYITILSLPPFMSPASFPP